MQRVFKHSLKRSYHSDVVQEISQQLAHDKENLVIDKCVAIMCDRSVTWMWDAFKTVGKPIIVKKAFEMCRVREYNLSYESLTGFAARDKLRKLKSEDPHFWEELTKVQPQETTDTTNTNEDIETEVDLYDDTSFDDTDVPCAVVIADMVGACVAAGIERVDGRLGSKTDAESLEFEGNNHSEGSADVAEELGQGRRNKKANTLYSHTFWRHHDDGET
ncbi:hypothetical protein DEU56DRAFT_740628 [Suillus clintonianus]|uniref:uncharacterized protein n=1 Tax=Suillus clintonianus TaxID=1904413 RepID=UPI001B87E594|nr:uncharacterized protein DEU56DRAFT_740628 [Suillus clintonianus]KAG2130398.1 hypothetical protein DEU56DRAFT_740628 [Suillus clintonianus]